MLDAGELGQLTQRQIVLLQFACTERANAIRESLSRSRNGRGEEMAVEYDSLSTLLGKHVEVNNE